MRITHRGCWAFRTDIGQPPDLPRQHWSGFARLSDGDFRLDNLLDKRYYYGNLKRRHEKPFQNPPYGLARRAGSPLICLTIGVQK
jgi:hypothetical protein